MIITKEIAYNLWIDEGFDEIMPFKDPIGGFDFLSELKSRGFTIIESKATEEQIDQYLSYREALDKWETINGKINDGEQIPLEIQELNPFNSNEDVY